MPSEERVAVKLTVPEDQKDAWTAHADALDMSRNEFLATMVQAGRRVFEQDTLEPRPPDANPRGNGLERYVLDALSDGGALSFETLADSLVDELDDELRALTRSGGVEYSGRDGRFTLAGGPDGYD